MSVTINGLPVLMDYAGQLSSYLADRWPESRWPLNARLAAAEEKAEG